MFITKFKLANLVTYGGIIASLLAIIFSYKLNIKISFICFIMAGICDMLDGRFARLFKRTEEEKEIGIQMDSLADVLSFLIVPVVLSLGMGMNKWYNIIIYMVYVVCGITRLGYFNVFANEMKQNNKSITVYSGLAVTYASLIFPMVYLLRYVVNEITFNIIFAGVMLVVSFLFMLNVKVDKPGKVAYVVYILLAVFVSCLIILL